MRISKMRINTDHHVQIAASPEPARASATRIVVAESSFRPLRQSRWLNHPGKRAFDLVLAVAVIPFIAPLTAVLLALASLDGGPALYAQDRVGRGGKHFKMWKIRTMVVDADERLRDQIRSDPKVAAEWLKYQKLRNDPRISRLGRLLRPTSLDELPQLWNVLKGDMSFVGPRPFLPSQRPIYDSVSKDNCYYRMRPGITGLWQINQRNDCEFKGRARFDCNYSERSGFFLDLKIILWTIPAVLSGKGH